MRQVKVTSQGPAGWRRRESDFMEAVNCCRGGGGGVSGKQEKCRTLEYQCRGEFCFLINKLLNLNEIKAN